MSTTRVQLELPEKSLERLKAIKELTEASSYAEVIRKSLQLYEGLLQEVEKGNQILVKCHDGNQVSYKLIF